jgi:polar amino acid transport system substrate-binding protein
MLKSGKVDVFAANKANLFELSDKLPGSRVLDGRIGVDEVALALPKGRETAMAYVRKYSPSNFAPQCDCAARLTNDIDNAL